jgi:hypothetical protein
MDRRENTCYQYAAVALDKMVSSFLWIPGNDILISDFVISFVTSYQSTISGNLKFFMYSDIYFEILQEMKIHSGVLHDKYSYQVRVK